MIPKMKKIKVNNKNVRSLFNQAIKALRKNSKEKLQPFIPEDYLKRGYIQTK